MDRGTDPFTVRPLWHLARVADALGFEYEADGWSAALGSLGQLVVTPRGERTEDTSGDALDVLETLYSTLLMLAGVSAIPTVVLALTDTWTAADALAGIPIGISLTGATVAMSAAIVQWSKVRRTVRETTAAWLALTLALPIGIVLGVLASATLMLG